MSYQFTGPTSVAPGQERSSIPLGTAPAVNPPRWSGKKTAIAAALALGLGGATAATAAAADPAHGTSQRGGPMMGPGGPPMAPGGPGQGPWSQNGPQSNGQGQPGPGHRQH